MELEIVSSWQGVEYAITTVILQHTPQMAFHTIAFSESTQRKGGKAYLL